MHKLYQPVLAAVLGAAVGAQEVSVFHPRGANPGEEVKMTAYGRDIGDAVGLLFDRPGIELLSVEPVEKRTDRVVLKLRLAEDCGYGRHLLTLHTKRGVAKARSFHVGPLPSIREAREANGTPETAQRIELEHTIDGRIESEDVDWYEVAVEKGQRVVFEVEGARLGDSDFDPELELRDGEGSLLQRVDDVRFGFVDPLIVHTFETATTARIGVRDVRAGGSSLGFYRLHVGTFPRPIGAIPVGARPGEDTKVRWIEMDGLVREATFEAPVAGTGYGTYPVIDGRVPPTPAPWTPAYAPIVLEHQPPKEVPSAPVDFCGQLVNPGAEDRYQVALKKGQRISIDCLARRLGGALDPVVYIRNAEDRVLAGDDDGGPGVESRLRYRVPEDGIYTISVRDDLRRAGPEYWYRLQVRVERPGSMYLTESVPGQLPENHGVLVPQGGRTATILLARNLNRSDSVLPSMTALPEGVTAASSPFVNGADTVPVVFEAKPDAALGAAKATATYTSKSQKEPKRVRLMQNFPLLRVENNRPFVTVRQDELPVAVGAPSPFSLDVEQPKVPLIRGASVRLRCHLGRVDDYAGRVTIRSIWTPPGLSFSSSSLGKGKHDTEIVVSARSNAAVKTWPVVLVAEVREGRLVRRVSSQIVQLSVEEPWITATAQRVRTEQGSPTTLSLKLEPTREALANLRLEALRVPSGVKIEIPKTLNPSKDSIELPVQVAKDARPGRTSRVYFRLWIPTEGGDVLQQFGLPELRVDKPLPDHLRKKKVGTKTPPKEEM